MSFRKHHPPTFELPRDILHRQLRELPQAERLHEAIRLRMTNAAHIGIIANISGPKMGRLIRGQEPTYREAMRLAEILRVDPDLLFGAKGRAASREATFTRPA